jgi:hypothetical protein
MGRRLPLRDCNGRWMIDCQFGVSIPLQVIARLGNSKIGKGARTGTLTCACFEFGGAYVTQVIDHYSLVLTLPLR